jgi:mxaL protein
VILALLLIALLRPKFPMPREILNSIFVIDISQSMNTRDYLVGDKPTSRLQVVRDVLRKSLATMPCGSRMGLAIFSEYRSFLLLSPVEVCENYAELSASIDHISGKMAWAGGSEIAKGLNWGLKMAVQIEPRPSLVFLTDGHEAPPISFKNRPRIDVKAGDVRGVLIGIGNDELSPIPKLDPDGNVLGFWQADEVAQIDIYSKGRAGSVSGEKMADDDASAKKKNPTEHLSAVKETYLKLLAQENGLGYARLSLPVDLVTLLASKQIAQRASIPTPIGWIPALLALLSLIAMYLWRRR